MLYGLIDNTNYQYQISDSTYYYDDIIEFDGTPIDPEAM